MVYLEDPSPNGRGFLEINFKALAVIEPDYMQESNPTEPAFQLYSVLTPKVFLPEPPGPPIIRVLILVLLDTIMTANERGEHENNSVIS
jgi:hypothetical protein